MMLIIVLSLIIVFCCGSQEDGADADADAADADDAENAGNVSQNVTCTAAAAAATKNKTSQAQLSHADHSSSTATLFLGDAIDLIKQLDDKSVRLILLDPPYGQSQAQSNHYQWDKIWSRHFWRELLSNVWRVLSDGGRLVVFGTGEFYLDMCIAVREESIDKDGKKIVLGYQPHQWNFQGSGVLYRSNERACNQVQYVAENVGVFFQEEEEEAEDVGIFYLKKGSRAAPTNPKATEHGIAMHLDQETRRSGNVLKARKNRQFGSLKPPELYVKLIGMYTKEGDMVADFTLYKRGVAAYAALQTGRRFVGCEAVPEHFEEACKWLGATDGAGDTFKVTKMKRRTATLDSLPIKTREKATLETAVPNGTASPDIPSHQTVDESLVPNRPDESLDQTPTMSPTVSEGHGPVSEASLVSSGGGGPELTPTEGNGPVSEASPVSSGGGGQPDVSNASPAPNPMIVHYNELVRQGLEPEAAKSKTLKKYSRTFHPDKHPEDGGSTFAEFESYAT
jgi:DNA modification methylase